VVEDDEATREAFALILTGLGYRVSTADNGQVALDYLRGERPSLIVLDLMMPVMDGYQFREAQRRDATLADIPVIVCSALGEAHDGAAALNAAAYLRKPVDPGALLDAVRRLC
jgi:CheY-like chemotaxis protein